MSLYPTLTESQPDQTFRLGRIQQLDKSEAKGAEERRRTQKNYLRAVNVVHGVSTMTGVVGLAREATGLPLMLTVFGALPGAVLSGLSVGTFSINVICDAVNRRCTEKDLKHAEKACCAIHKLNSIHTKKSRQRAT